MNLLFRTKVAKRFFNRYFNIPLDSAVVSIGKDNIHFTKDYRTFTCRAWQIPITQFPIFKKIQTIAILPFAFLSKGFAFLLLTDNTATNNKDDAICLALPTNNFGTSDTVGYVASQINNENWRFLLHFTLPSGTGTISSITLNLYTQSGCTGTNTGLSVEVHELTRTNWTENGATWNKYDGTNNWTTAGGDYSTTVVDSLAHSNTVGQWRVWDMIGANATNPISGLTWGSQLHLLLRFSTENNNPNQAENYNTKESASNKPYVEVTYTTGSSTSIKTFNGMTW